MNLCLAIFDSETEDSVSLPPIGDMYSISSNLIPRATDEHSEPYWDDSDSDDSDDSESKDGSSDLTEDRIPSDDGDSDESDSDKSDDSEHVGLNTYPLGIIAKKINYLQIHFTAEIAPIFNALQQDKVNTIDSEIKSIKPMIEELVTDEYVELYHRPQCERIKTHFDKLYSTIANKVRNWTPPLVNRGGTLDRTSINNYRYYL